MSTARRRLRGRPRAWRRAHRPEPRRERLRDGLPLVWLAGGAAFALLYLALRAPLGETGGTLAGGFVAVAGTVAAARFATTEATARRATLEGLAFAGAVVGIYWLVFVWPLPEPWW